MGTIYKTYVHMGTIYKTYVHMGTIYKTYVYTYAHDLKGMCTHVNIYV